MQYMLRVLQLKRISESLAFSNSWEVGIYKAHPGRFHGGRLVVAGAAGQETSLHLCNRGTKCEGINTYSTNTFGSRIM